MKRIVFTLIAAAGAYGFSIGCVHSLRYGVHNVIKFPLFLLVTASVCGLAYFVVASAFGAGLKFAQVQTLSFSLFRDASVLLASFATVSLFLSLALQRPDAKGLHEYPLFMAANVVLIGFCGVVALLRQSRDVLTSTTLTRTRAGVLVACWLALSLFVGSQAAWFFRPFFGVATISADATPFFLGTQPDFRGATSFYEALWDLFDPPNETRIEFERVTD
ncbi:MAG: hypothetical protein JNM17_39070 [Archangium sp.]|nr:hypothetical protein [Archangium sp.]